MRRSSDLDSSSLSPGTIVKVNDPNDLEIIDPDRDPPRPPSDPHSAGEDALDAGACGSLLRLLRARFIEEQD